MAAFLPSKAESYLPDLEFALFHMRRPIAMAHSDKVSSHPACIPLELLTGRIRTCCNIVRVDPEG